MTGYDWLGLVRTVLDWLGLAGTGLDWLIPNNGVIISTICLETKNSWLGRLDWLAV